MLYIGTSGWTYKDWQGAFYPADLSNKEWLKFYSAHFKTVEINASFYHEMAAKTYANWHGAVANDFIFSVKISRFITHIKKLNDPKESWIRFISHAQELKEKLGPILFQLPQSFKADKTRLESLLKIIPRKKYRVALEPRHESWFNGEIFNLLGKYNTAMVIADSGERWPSVISFLDDYKNGGCGDAKFCVSTEKWSQSEFIYIRMHGPQGTYGTKYDIIYLEQVARKIKEWQKQNLDVYIYFNNDAHGYAVENGKELKNMLGD